MGLLDLAKDEDFQRELREIVGKTTESDETTAEKAAEEVTALVAKRLERLFKNAPDINGD